MRGLAVLLLSALAACGQPSASEPAPTAQSSEAAAAPAVPAEPAQASEASQQAAPAIALDGEGLRLVDSRGSARLLAFGSDRAMAEALLPETAERSTIEECGAGPMQFVKHGGLTLNMQDGKFVGWYLEDASKLTTMDGIGLGTRRSEIEKSRALEMLEDSTLGDEFALGTLEDAQMFGFLDGRGANAKVTALYAGLNCFFR